MTAKSLTAATARYFGYEHFICRVGVCPAARSLSLQRLSPTCGKLPGELPRMGGIRRGNTSRSPHDRGELPKDLCRRGFSHCQRGNTQSAKPEKERRFFAIVPEDNQWQRKRNIRHHGDCVFHIPENRHQEGAVWCDDKSKCAVCGWNPRVSEERIRKYKEVHSIDKR